MNASRRPTPAVLRFWRLPLALGLTVLALDQASKLLVLSHWPVGVQHPVIPGFFTMVHCRNPGAAWSLFADYTEILALLSAVVLVALVLWFDRLVDGFPERALALGVVFGGIAGNLIDRTVYGEVVDFLLFYWRSFQWPVFNLADSAISCGVTVFVISSFCRRQADEQGSCTELPVKPSAPAP